MESESDNPLFKENKNIWTTWNISFDKIKSLGDDGEAACNLLRLWSCLNKADMSYEIIQKVYPQTMSKYPTLWSRVSSWLESIANDELKFTNTIRLLRRYSMLEMTQESECYSIHPVVHEWVYHSSSPDQSRILANIAVMVIRTAIPPMYPVNWEDIYRYKLHLFKCLSKYFLTNEDPLEGKSKELKAELGDICDHHVWGLIDYLEESRREEIKEICGGDWQALRVVTKYGRV